VVEHAVGEMAREVPDEYILIIEEREPSSFSCCATEPTWTPAGCSHGLTEST